MYSAPAVGSARSQNARRSLGAELRPARPRTRGSQDSAPRQSRGPDRSRTCLAMYSAPAVERGSFQQTDEGLIRVLRCSAIELRRDSTSRIAPAGFEPATPGL